MVMVMVMMVMIMMIKRILPNSSHLKWLTIVHLEYLERFFATKCFIINLWRFFFWYGNEFALESFYVFAMVIIWVRILIDIIERWARVLTVCLIMSVEETNKIRWNTKSRWKCRNHCPWCINKLHWIANNYYACLMAVKIVLFYWLFATNWIHYAGH